MRTRLAAIGALVALAACAPSPTDFPGSSATPAASVSATPMDWGPLAVSKDFRGGDLALTSGILRITESCVLLEAPTGSTELPVWSMDRTTWDAGARVVRFGNIDGTVVTIGDGQRVSFGGSGTAFRDAAPAEITPWETWLARIAWEAEPDPACSPDGPWSVDGSWSVGGATVEP